MLKHKDSANNQRELALLGLQFLFLVGIALLIYITPTENGGDFDNLQTLGIVFGGGVALIAGLALSIFIRPLNQATPIILIVGDAILAAAFTYVADGEPTILIAIIAILAAIGLQYSGSMFGTVQAVAVIALGIGAVIYVSQGADNSIDFNIITDTYTTSFIAIILIIGISNGWVYVQGAQDRARNKTIDDIKKESEAKIEQMKERTRSIATMSAELSSTLNYERILDAALVIGEVSIRENPKQRVISMVALFRYAEDSLHIVNARGFDLGDFNRNISATAGIIGKTLEEGTPIIERNITKDPVLRGIQHLKGMKSALCIPLRAHYDSFGIILYLSNMANTFQEDSIDYLNAIGIQATIALQNSVLYNSLMEEKERIIQMETDARKSIVRDLHDVPTQTISAVVMKARIAQRMAKGTSPDLEKELAEIEKMTNRATEEIRHVLFKLRPLSLESQGLTSALGQLADKFKETFNQACTIKIHPDVEKYLDSVKQGALFYLIEEAANNARKYANASMITVQAARRGSEIILQIIDNGDGFDSKAVDAGYDERGSFGMVNMRERAELVDGTLTLKSEIGKGTRITVVVPIDLSKANVMTGEHHAVPMDKLTASAQARIGQ